MKVSDLIEKCGLKVFSGKSGLENKIAGAYVSDLLSDVMGNARENEVWITLQTHQNVMAVASLKDLAAVILVKGFEPEAGMLEKSNEEGIPLLGTQDGTFETAGKLYKILLEE
ncbi:MAG: serine kinase [Prolixibacteraceae bacterium]|nr:serine kinase [Prolixibacteraceae bacterium]